MDRQRFPPFLIRLFLKHNEHHNSGYFETLGSSPCEDEYHVYAWHDSTLREITDMLKDVSDELRLKQTKLSFRLVYPATDGKPCFVDLGIVSNSTKGFIDSRPLGSLKFQTGDYLDVAVFVT